MKTLTVLRLACWAVLAWTCGCGDDDVRGDAAAGRSTTAPMDSGADGARPPPDGMVQPPPDAATADGGLFGSASEVELVQAFLTRSFDPSSEDAGMTPQSVTPGDITLAVRDGRGQLTYIASATCGEPFEALMARDGDEVRVLFRSRGATACGGALYRMRVVIEDADADTRVNVYRQEAEAATIERVGNASAAGAAADCEGLVPCSAAQPCDREGPISDELVIDAPDDTHGCTTLDVCGGNACIDHREACLMTCGKPDCAILESYPVQVRCDGQEG
jgi:hypothetical protein